MNSRASSNNTPVFHPSLISGCDSIGPTIWSRDSACPSALGDSQLGVDPTDDMLYMKCKGTLERSDDNNNTNGNCSVISVRSLDVCNLQTESKDISRKILECESRRKFILNKLNEKLFMRRYEEARSAETMASEEKRHNQIMLVKSERLQQLKCRTSNLRNILFYRKDELDYHEDQCIREENNDKMLRKNLLKLVEDIQSLGSRGLQEADTAHQCFSDKIEFLPYLHSYLASNNVRLKRHNCAIYEDIIDKETACKSMEEMKNEKIDKMGHNMDSSNNSNT